MSNLAMKEYPTSLLASREVVSAAGSPIKVIKLTLTAEGRASLQSKSTGIRLHGDKTFTPKKVLDSK